MPKPDRGLPAPLWEQVLTDLLRRLAAGEFVDGVPPERELVAEYGVSRHTLRFALGRMQTAGILERGRGRGTFLRSAAIEQPTGILYSLFRSVEEQGFVQRSLVLDLCTTSNPTIASRLQLKPKAKLVYLHRVRFADDTPIAVDQLWLPHALAAPLLEADFAHTSLYNELDVRCGLRPGAGNERISPTIPSPDESALLQTGPMEPAFLIERATDWKGTPLEWRRTVVRGDHYAFVTMWDGDGLGANPSLASLATSRTSHTAAAQRMSPKSRRP